MVHSKFAAANDASRSTGAMPAKGSVPFSIFAAQLRPSMTSPPKTRVAAVFGGARAKQIEAILPAFPQELPEREHFRNAPKLVCDKIVFIENADRLAILHYRRNMGTEMHDYAALQIIRTYLCCARRG